MRILKVCLYCIVLGWPISAGAAERAEHERLLQGEVLFESLQGKHLDALLKLNTNPALISGGPLPGKPGLAELQLAFGLYELAEQNIKPPSGGDLDQQARNRAAHRLARYYYSSHRPMQALQTLDSIQGHGIGASARDVQYLRALTLLKLGRFREAADLLANLPDHGRSNAFIRYNLALAQLQAGNEDSGTATLTALGKIESSDAESLALKDMANLKLGYRYLETGKPELAKASFNRIRLDGPLTNQALLGAGWASFSMNQPERAIVAWSLLHEQEAVNDIIIEAKMALPYAYSKMGAHGKAANLYAHAIELFDAELSRLDVSIEAISRGELRQALLDRSDRQGDDGFVVLSRHGGKQQTFYLPLLLSSDEFRALSRTQNQLARVKERVEQGQNSIAALIELGRFKQKYYASTLPATEKELRAIDQRLKSLAPEDTRPLTPELIRLQSSYAQYLETRDATANDHQQLPDIVHRLSELSTGFQRLDKKLDAAIANTGKHLERVALEILDQKRSQLQDYRTNALFALAESYDFATGKSQ